MEEINVEKKTNKVVLLINCILSSVLAVAYTAEFFKGQRSLQYIIIFVTAVIVPIICALVIYFKNKESVSIKYITLIGYLIVYTISIITSSSSMAFVYIFPIMVMYLLYFNMKLTVYGNAYVFALNLGVIIYKVVSQKLTAGDITDLEIQFAAITLFAISVILSTKLSNQFNFNKISSIEKHQEKQEAILSNILKAADILDTNAYEVQSFMKEFTVSMNQVSSAIDEISKGAQDTSESMTQQSVATEQISKLIQTTSQLSDKMKVLSKNSKDDVNKGLGIINQLDLKAVTVNEQSIKVEEHMEELEKKTDEILGITEIIAGISAQTNLLSLNASIEAARAGEAGKGFAVVADEIRQLADQSKQSSSKISTILNELNETVKDCVEQIQSMKNANQEQNEYITSTKNIYHHISENTKQLSNNIEEVNSGIETIVQSNEQIIESVNKIAAVSQQTAASSEEANAMANANLQNAEELMKKLKVIINTSDEMKSYAK
jgi:methyl-accepting chemotaxis protein